MLGSHSVLVRLYRGLQFVLSKTIRIGDIKHHSYRSFAIVVTSHGVCI